MISAEVKLEDDGLASHECNYCGGSNSPVTNNVLSPNMNVTIVAAAARR